MKKILYLLLSLNIFSDNEILINNIIFEGNKEIPAAVLIREIKTKINSPFSLETLNDDYNKLKNNKYLKNVAILTKIANGKLNIIFNLEEKNDVYMLLKEDNIYTISDFKNKKTPGVIKDISIEGLFYLDKNVVEKEIYLKLGNFFSLDEFNLSKYNLESSGFFRKVSASYVKDGDDIYVTFSVNENLFLKNDSKIIGATLFSNEELLEIVKTKKGTVLNTKVLEKDINEIHRKYKDNDYIYLGVSTYVEDEGLIIKLSEAKVGKVSFKRQNFRENIQEPLLNTKEYILAREVDLKEGDFLKNTDINRAINKIRRLGYFTTIIPEVAEITSDRRDIVFKLVEEKGGLTLNGTLSGTIEKMIANISFSNNNFLGRSQKINLSYQYEFRSGWKGNFSFFDPWIYGTNGLSFGIDLYRFHSLSSLSMSNNSMNKSQENDIYSGLSLKVGHKIFDNIVLSIKNDFRIVSYLDYSNQLLDAYSEYILSSIFEYDNRDNQIDPSYGLLTLFNIDWNLRFKAPHVKYINFDLKPNIIASEWKNYIYIPFIFEDNIIAAKVSTGFSSFISAKGPFFEKKFFLGGASTLRGYEPYSIMGMSYILLNLENRITLYKGSPKVEIALFFDIGNSTEIEKIFDLTDYKKSLGISLRLKNFIIPILVDFSLPLDEKENYIRTEINLQYMF